LDNFKIVNDSPGHQGGDALLVAVASVLQESVRTIDCVTRLGGDEFIALMPETDLKGARIVVERIRSAVEGALEAGDWPATVSVGLVTFIRMPASIDELVKTADDLMYSVRKGSKESVAELVIQVKPP